MDRWKDETILSMRADQIAKSLNGWHIENALVLPPTLTHCGSNSLVFLLFLRL